MIFSYFLYNFLIIFYHILSQKNHESLIMCDIIIKFKIKSNGRCKDGKLENSNC